jgi:predicted metal-binding protein
MTTTTLYVCETCRFTPSLRDHEGRTGGEILFAALAEQLHATPLIDLRLASTRCLMACARHCSVHLRAPGKISYVIGDFTPDRESAETLLDYIGKYQQSATGQVPYSTWPEGIKGHFVARMPPLDD